MVRNDLPREDDEAFAPTGDAQERVELSPSAGDVTRILGQIEQGEPQQSEQLLPLVYEELRKLAAAKMAQEKPGQTLQATALVHEAYVRLVGQTTPQRWDSRGHFFAAAAEAMRRILVDRARHKETLRAGGHAQRVDLEPVELSVDEPVFDLLALDLALDQLAREHPRKAALVKLRFFAGLKHTQAAATLGISTSTADADWDYAKCWLRVRMAGGSSGGSCP